MLLAGGLQSTSLDMPTLSLVAVCIAGLLGLFLIIDWMQQRNVRALAWWGSAYLIGASAMALGNMPPSLIKIPMSAPGALTFLACGMVWNGVRLFQGRRVLPLATFIGAAVWLGLARIPGLMENGNGPILGAMIVPVYTFFIAIELWRERRRTRYSRAAAIVVPCLHAGIFLVPLAMRAFLPDGYNAAWLTVFTLETILYAVGTAFIVMLMVKDHHVHVYRTAACTDHLTGLLNRRTFLDNALALCAKQGKRSEPVAMLMFDLDYFKSINDRFGHAAGDEVLRVFGRVVRASTRMDDIIGRFGGEEFRIRWRDDSEPRHRCDGEYRCRHFLRPGQVDRCADRAGRCRALPRQARGPESSAYRRRGNGSRAGAPDRRCTPSPCPAHAGFCKNFAAQHGRLIDGPLGASDRNLSFTLFAVPYGHVAFAESCPQRCRHA